MTKSESPEIPTSIDEFLEDFGERGKNVGFRAYLQRLTAGGATAGALISPEVLGIPENITSGTLGGVAVYFGLKSIHASLKNTTMLGIAAAQSLDEISRLK